MKEEAFVKPTTLSTMELRVLVKSLSRSADAVLSKMDRVGKRPELIAEYEALDTLIIKTRLELVAELRKVAVEEVWEGEEE